MSNPSRDTALFVPLKAEYFHDFATGLKTTEYRLYGPRWNERTCRPGRPVVLSLGYGKRNRLMGRVASFIADYRDCLDGATMRELSALFPASTGHTKIACIGIELEAPHVG